MKFLYDELGDWYLAMAAYDHGAGNIQHAVARTGYADFWELYKRHELPAETQNYVPEILAAIIIANHPAQYGFDDVTLDPPVLTDTVTINYSIDLRLVSDLVGAPVDEIEALNPSLLRMVTPPDASFDLHLPAGTATLFDQRVALIPEARRNSWRYHPVAAGDTLETVAQEYRVPVADLAAANQLEQGRQHCRARGAGRAGSTGCRTAARTRLYIVRRGDTLVTIADRFGVSLEPTAALERNPFRHPGRRRAAACTWPSPQLRAPRLHLPSSRSRDHRGQKRPAPGLPPRRIAESSASRSHQAPPRTKTEASCEQVAPTVAPPNGCQSGLRSARKSTAQ